MIAKSGVRPNPAISRSLRRRGQPLIALAVMLSGWAGVRVCALTLLTEPVSPVAAKPAALVVVHVPKAGQKPAKAGAGQALDGWQAPLSPTPIPAAVLANAPLPAEPINPAVQPLPPMSPSPSARLRLAGGHQALWLAALGQIPLPPEFSRLDAGSDAHRQPHQVLARATPTRWSADGWLMLRRGGGPALTGAFAGSYGASQAGAVLRYRLAPGDARKPTGYLRASAALNGTREQELALGLSARPISHFPVVAMAELRAARSVMGTRMRPAAALITELPPLRLPAGLRAEAYAQAGYVGGAGATAFIDGQVRLDRKLFDLASHELRAGAGAWGGAQRGASRVDLGPSASVVLRLGDAASARLAMDWRFRVAGKAAPSSGPAVTLSAGF